ncbi:MAG: hypothetical protein ACRDL7_09000, partial [Gaiellaceae bacterium]
SVFQSKKLKTRSTSRMNWWDTFCEFVGLYGLRIASFEEENQIECKLSPLPGRSASLDCPTRNRYLIESFQILLEAARKLLFLVR